MDDAGAAAAAASGEQRADSEIMHLRALVSRLQGARGAGLRGWRRTPVRDLFGRHDVNKARIKSTYGAVVWPDGLVLKQGWHVYSEAEDTFCQIFLDNCQITVPLGYTSIEDYWQSVIVVYLHYLVSYKRSSVMLRLRRNWMSELRGLTSLFPIIVPHLAPVLH